MATINAVNTSLSGQTGSGNFAGSNSPTLVTPRINQIIDTNGNIILSMLQNPSAVNYIQIRNSMTGSPPTINAEGVDTNINIGNVTKGTGRFTISSLNTIPLQVNSGTLYQHTSLFAFANTANTNTFTFPDASGTILLTAGSGGMRSFQVFTSGAGIYTPTVGTGSIIIEIVGGGGAGGGCVGGLLSFACGGGGASGSYGRHFIASVGASYVYSVGSGGTPGAAGNNPGGNGTASTFGGILSSPGGLGGRPGGSVAGGGANGGLATGCNLLNATGTQGGTGVALSGNATPGTGGSSIFGGGANAPTVTGGSGNGLAGSNYGGGGSGGYALNLLANAAGGAGSLGVIIIWEFA